MRTIVRLVFGSQLYGTSTPASDQDFKAVHVPDARDILLGRARPSVSNTRRPKEHGEKNAADEVDEESYSLLKFMRLVQEGQTVALDVLFAPASALLHADSLWDEIVANRHRLLTRKSASFLGYCRTQSAKYGIKGSRVAASRAALAMLESGLADLGSTARLRDISTKCEQLALHAEHVAIVPIRQIDGTDLPHLEVCNRKLSYGGTIKHARDVVQRLVDEFGQRALQAETNQGVDWKALSHAVRVGTQALELLRTAHVTFPLPNAAYLLEIKQGLHEYRHVASVIEQLLEDVEAAADASTLPDAPDEAWIDNLVCRAYGQEVGRYISNRKDES